MPFSAYLAELALSDRATVIIAFLVYFLDNILLTAVVPVVPDLLEDEADRSSNGTHFELQGKIGVLFASKSLVQLVVNPFAGYLAYSIGYKWLIYIGAIVYAVSSLLFAFCESYAGLFAARSIHGVASAISIISGHMAMEMVFAHQNTGLSLLASTYPEDAARSRAMGFALGGMAVGVLVGYPLGGVVYGFFTKFALFLLIFWIIVICGAIQFYLLKNRPNTVVIFVAPASTVKSFFKDPYVILCLLSIGISTASIATLEPCLPIWLRTNIKPKEWQIGTAFLPDSIGYLIGTNLFGIVALKVGRWLCAFASHISISVSLFLIPFSTKMAHLIVPHFGIGLGIAVIDASLMPLLALLAEGRGVDTVYTAIYALSQMAVCCAYAFGPFIGGWLMGAMGFRGMLWGLATANFLFSPFTFLMRCTTVDEEQQAILRTERPQNSYRAMQANSLLDSD